MKQLYLEIYEYGKTIIAPIETVSVLFILKYLKTKVPLILVKDVFKTSSFSFPAAVLDKFHISIIPKAELCEEAQNCLLPAICAEEKLMFVTGLCAVVRRILKHAKENGRAEISQKLLGFRGGCLTACAEVSVWTKFCEIDVLNTTKAIISGANTTHEIKIPLDLLRFEAHLQQPVRVHNISKKRQDLAKKHRNNSKIDRNTVASEGCAPSVRNIGQNTSTGAANQVQNSEEALDLSNDKNLPPWLRIKPKLVRIDRGKDCDQSVEDLMLEVSKLAVDDNRQRLNSIPGESLPHLTHAYAEGADMTLADVMLFSYIHLILSVLQRQVNDLRFQIPLVLKWYSRVMLDENITYAMSELNFTFDLIEAIDNHSENPARCSSDAFPDVVKMRLENKNISHFRTPHRDSYPRCPKTKIFTRQCDIDNVFEKLKEASIEVLYSQHPCTNVALDWTALPEVAHPSFGELPNSRILRKCQQIENLVSVVLKIANQGDVIVDFCSGGGHLGIVLAYLLPRCRVIMIDNKEESLIRAKQRVQVLGLTNTVLYQSNLEYFTGHFDIGTSLHACGVATDLVLKRCIDEKAAFVVCPCCYGAVQNNHLITYPRSDAFKQIGITYNDYLVLGHSADQTHINDPKTEQGKQCMGLIDTDRLNQCAKFEYKRLLCTLTPTTCTPKNNLLIGFPAATKEI